MLNTGKNLQEFSLVLTYPTILAEVLDWNLPCCACFQSKCSERNDVSEETLSSGFLSEKTSVNLPLVIAKAQCQSPLSGSLS